MSDLRDDTERFWRATANLDPLPRLQRYIRELLPRELAWARADKSQQRLPDRSYGVLVLLVGHAFEPLLQSVCAYKPAEVLLVLNHRYSSDTSGNDMARRLKMLLPYLKGVDGLETLPTVRPHTTVDDTPSAVFRYLLTCLRGDWTECRSVVVDITGAKKSMVAGAFFFAAYANVPISYVDFDEYSERYSRPYGYTCNIGLIDNPYRDFRLRDWAQVRRLYRQYSFAAAGQALNRVCAEMKRSDFFRPRETDAARQLLSAIEVYQAWDNGDYRAAKQKTEGPESPLPDEGIPWAVRVLGDLWPHASEGGNADWAAQQILKLHTKLKHGDPDPEDSIFAQPETLLAYVQDELAKIERLVQPKEDYRAAYLRAAALDEFLLKARLALCWLHGELILEGKPVTRAELGDEGWRKRFKKLADHSGGYAMRAVLLRKAGKQLSGVGVQLAPHAPKLDRYWQGMPLDLDTLRDLLDEWQRPVFIRLRGEAVHTHLYLTREIANAAVALVRASVEEFIDNWLGKCHPDVVTDSSDRLTSAPGWDDLCRLCGIDFLPPYQEEDE